MELSTPATSTRLATRCATGGATASPSENGLCSGMGPASSSGSRVRRKSGSATAPRPRRSIVDTWATPRRRNSRGGGKC
eukprot:3001696-Pyramimonas_sp.AAC.1